ncbi:glutaredoxin domain-containing cysteine-rich protein CG31559-like [Copidosoma floridanum]|uniref:glutaredoxin domain-containing cysteine-rich protein CG31559-like n=1 Tax=Copidosoma floridanum TaxID=29053 RepID=UPI0006C98B27|nr:glutaredoxin domain-containing cysteine-rich protein CG31559-like [Copidosoma floridanum]
MDALVRMSAPPALSLGHHQSPGARHSQTVSVCSPPTPSTAMAAVDASGVSCSSSPPRKESSTAGATVFVAAAVATVAAVAAPPSTCSITTTRVPEVPPQQQQFPQQSRPAGHVVKIQINPEGCEPGRPTARLVSAVRLNLEEPETSVNIIDNHKEAPIAIKDLDNSSDNNNNSGASGIFKARLVNTGEPCVRISVKGGDCSGRESSSSSSASSTSSSSEELVHPTAHPDMVQQPLQHEQSRCTGVVVNGGGTSNGAGSGGFYYGTPLMGINGVATVLMASGQCSPSETLDSGTCSDLDGTPPPLPKKKASNNLDSGKIGPNAAPSNKRHYHHHHQRAGSLTSSGAELDSDDNESSISCDSLNSADMAIMGLVADPASELAKQLPRQLEELAGEGSGCREEGSGSEGSPPASGNSTLSKASSSTPRVRSPEVRAYSSCSSTGSAALLVNESTYEERRLEQRAVNGSAVGSVKYAYEDDRFYKFHVNEREEVLKARNKSELGRGDDGDDESFAGCKIPTLDREAIRSAKGTVRGVRNRVRAGIATFLQKPSAKNYKVKDADKVVVYTTTMGIVRETYYRCVLVKQILRTHMVKYEERDMYMSTELQTELRERIGCTAIKVPQLFIDGQHIGDADAVERLNESGELRQMLKPYKSLDACNTCQACGGYRLLPCPVCNGSKKSVHRNDFTAEFVALKCMNCDEVGLVRCQHC